MTHRLSVLDRLRIERVVWELDQRTYDLPHRRRIAIRREVRDNLRSASAELGAAQAVRNLGSVAELATGYLDAQYGTRPRPSWIAAVVFVLTTLLVLQAVLADAALAYRDGALAAAPSVTGTKHWQGLHFLQTDVTYHFTGHSASMTGGALSPWAWLTLLIGGIAAGRLWRAVPRKARQDTRT